MSLSPHSHRLLIAESPLQILPSLAAAIGLNEAIVLQQVQYWLSTSTHVHDGRTWVYNTVDEWNQQFPFFAERTLRRTLDRLRDSGLLLTANFNPHKFDRTLWYSIDYDALETASGNMNTPSGQNGRMDLPVNGVSEMAAPSGQGVRSHVVNLTESCGQPDHMLIEQRLTPETTQETNSTTTRAGNGGGGGDERMEIDDEGEDDEGNSPEDSQVDEADTVNVKADLVDALVALGVRPALAIKAVTSRTVTSDRDVILCKRFILASTAHVPAAVLWSQYLSLGKLPPAAYSDQSSVTPDAVALARQMYEANEARARDAEQYTVNRDMAAVLSQRTLKSMDQPAKKRVFQWAQS